MSAHPHGAVLLAAILIHTGALDVQRRAHLPRPNILWISCDDTSPDFGCYGDAYARTPNIDAFAATGLVFKNAFTHAPISGPSRSGIITGQYPTSIGAHHSHARALAPAHLKCFTQYLRAAGYFCTNRGKTDYQLGAMRPEKGFDPERWSPLGAWDENGPGAHWRHRPDQKQPFFAVVNLADTGEPNASTHDPSQVLVPPYLPDTPTVRRAIAARYDAIRRLDRRVGELLAELKKDGLENNTIVWLWSVNGRDLPRNKRWLYDGGTRIALIVRVPTDYRTSVLGAAGFTTDSTSDELVGAIDFAPTMLSIAELPIPEHLHGRAFLGPRRAPAPDYLYAARDRIDEAYDCVRSVRGPRYRYIRNHLPHLGYMQPLAARDATPIMQELRQRHAADQLKDAGRRLFERKPVEELYDTRSDPHQIHNLTADPKLQTRLAEMREAQVQWSIRTGDIGLIPEVQFNRFKVPKHGILPCMPLHFRMAKGDRGQPAVQIASSTRDTTIVYQIDGRGSAGPRHWNLYTEPVSLTEGQVITAQAGCLGYEPSRPAEFKIGDQEATAATMQISRRAPHWMDNLQHTDLLQQLLALKRLDLDGSASLGRFYQAFDSDHSDLRYWALLGVYTYTQAESAVERRAAAKIYTLGLRDSSHAVSFAAARALCEFPNHRTAAQDRLRAGLGAKGLHAVFAALSGLAQVGGQAAPAQAEVRAFLQRASRFRELYGFATPPLLAAEQAAHRILQNLKQCP